jgi:hypothetical protein
MTRSMASHLTIIPPSIQEDSPTEVIIYFKE